jgi:hypothetical protein
MQHAFVSESYTRLSYYIILLLSRTQFKSSLFSAPFIYLRSRGSSVSIVSDYGLDDWAIGGLIPGRGKGFFLQPQCPDRL